MRPPYFTPKFVTRLADRLQTTKSTRILSIAIVENDVDVCLALGRLLRAAGMCTVVYPSVEIFLKAALPASFDCLVLDAQLAGTSGFDLHEFLRESGCPPPIFFLTAEEEPTELARALAAGGYGCFCKSGCGEAVVDAIRRAASDSIVQCRTSEQFTRIKPDSSATTSANSGHPLLAAARHRPKVL
jgi:FixJ family two-component response regulator